MKFVSSHRMSLFALAFSGVYLGAIFVLDLEVFEMFTDSLQAMEHYNVDEFVFPSLVIVIAIFSDALRRRRLNTIEFEKAKIYKAMITSVQHVMNNFLNQMQIFKMTADKTPGFDPRVLALYEVVIKDAMTQLHALSSVTRIDEQAIKTSVEPGFLSRPKSRTD